MPLIEQPLSPSQAQSQALLFDRDPKRFRVLLNFMRSGELVLEDGVSAQGIRQEADFFQLGAAVQSFPKRHQSAKHKCSTPAGRLVSLRAAIC